jgi:DNA repair protein RadD
VLDFGTNAMRLGPIDRIKITYRKNPLTGADESSVTASPVKECPSCRSVIPLSSRQCPDCEHVFPDTMRLTHEAEASTAPVLYEPEPPIEAEVVRVAYSSHVGKESGKTTFRVDYVLAAVGDVPVRTVSEWKQVSSENRWWCNWWRGTAHDSKAPVPNEVEEAVMRAEAGELATARRIRIRKDGKFWRVLRVLEWKTDAEVEAEAEANAEAEAALDAAGVNI